MVAKNGFVLEGRWMMDQDRASSSSAADDGHYVQVRYPHGERWLAVVNMVETRRAAARIAGDVYADRLDASGRAPTQVRVIITSKLMREGGQAALDRAVDDLSQSSGSRPRHSSARPGSGGTTRSKPRSQAAGGRSDPFQTARFARWVVAPCGPGGEFSAIRRRGRLPRRSRGLSGTAQA
jgi:hypothetical protein